VLSSFTMNPYASFLGDRDPLQVIAGTAKQLSSLMEKIGAQRAEQPPAPGKWSVREILCHLADCEAVFAFRLRQTLAQDHHVIQPFDQDQWARNYAAYTVPEALALFSAARQWNLALLRSLTPEAMDKQVTHPERGTMTFRAIVETMGGHDINHLRQIEAIADKSQAA
jgi:uncharacterized damage-inducible protein DinB